MDNKELSSRINQLELHIRNLRGELNEVGHALDALRRLF